MKITYFAEMDYGDDKHIPMSTPRHIGGGRCFLFGQNLDKTSTILLSCYFE